MPDESHLAQRLNFSRVIPGHILQTIVIDIAGPYMAYQFIYPHAPLLITLLLISLLPLGSLLNSIIREHTVDIIAIPTLLWLATQIGCSYLTLDPITLLLIQLAVPIGLCGIMILLSQWTGSPALLMLDRSLHNRDQKHPAYQQTMLAINNTWGWGLIILVGLLVIISRLLLNSFTGVILLSAAICFPLALIVWSINYRDSRESEWHTEDTNRSETAIDQSVRHDT